MKKLFLITLLAGSAIAVSAQNPFDVRRDNSFGRHDAFERNDRNGFYGRVDAINDDYSYRIDAVRRDPFLRHGEKRRRIRQLERERKMAINDCRDRYSRPYHSGFDRRHR